MLQVLRILPGRYFYQIRETLEISTPPRLQVAAEAEHDQQERAAALEQERLLRALLPEDTAFRRLTCEARPHSTSRPYVSRLGWSYGAWPQEQPFMGRMT